jgi:hypothetical protein
MTKVTIGEARVENAEGMAIILREIGWSERRNALLLEEVSKPIGELLSHC